MLPKLLRMLLLTFCLIAIGAPIQTYAEDATITQPAGTVRPPAAATTVSADADLVIKPDGGSSHKDAGVAAGSTKPGGGNELPGVNSEDPAEILQFIYMAFKDGKWTWAVALIFTLLALIFRKLLKDKIPKKVMPWIAIGLAVGTSLTTSLALGANWLNAIGAGVTAGLAAVGGWEALVKLFKKKEPAGAS